MKLDRFLARLKSNTAEDLRRIARDIGHELPRLRLPLLDRVRRELATAKFQDPYRETYALALRDVIAAFVAEVEGRVTCDPALYGVQQGEGSSTDG